jgi:hypothetical protein
MQTTAKMEQSVITSIGPQDLHSAVGAALLLPSRMLNVES